MLGEILTPERSVQSRPGAERNIEKKSLAPLSCVELLREFEKKSALLMGEKLQFSGVDGKDVYNISSPFLVGGETVISGRVESRETCAGAQIRFFKDENGFFRPITDAPTLGLEDGFAAKIDTETIIGGVKVYSNPTVSDPKRIDYQTVFYRGNNLSSLQEFAAGPELMKDIRLVSLPDKRIAAFTRPQGGDNGPGKIGYVELNSLDDINAHNLLKAEVIENQFAPGEWGGVNQAYLLPNGCIGALGHIAYRDEQNVRHYYAMSFIYDPKTHQASPIEIIATRKNFPVGAAKNSELEDVVFPGGLLRHNDGTATLYAGLSDAEAGYLKSSDPFIGEKADSQKWFAN